MRFSAERRRIFKIYKQVCEGCGAPFETTSHTQTRCKPACAAVFHNEYDVHVWQMFLERAKRYEFSPTALFKKILGRGSNDLWDRYSKRRNMSQESKARVTFILHKWIRDMDAGHYEIKDSFDVYVRSRVGRRHRELIRRAEPREAFCPKRLHHCKGGQFPGDCPRAWRDCEFSALGIKKKERLVKYEVRRCSVGELVSFRAVGKSVHRGRLGAARRIDGGEGKSIGSGDVLPSGVGEARQ
jgi:hypothetical protein